MKKFTLHFILLLCIYMQSSFGQKIPSYFFGVNHWMPVKYINHPTMPSGYVDYPNLQGLIKSAGTSIYRIGGTGYDTLGTAIFGTTDSTNDYIHAIQKIKNVNPNAKFIIQVPFSSDIISATQAGQLVSNVRIAFPLDKFYYSVGNEWDMYSKPSGGKYTSAEIKSTLISYIKKMKGTDSTIRIVGPSLAFYFAQDSLLQGIMNRLLGPTTDNLTGIISGTGTQADGKYYLDVIDYHTYAGGTFGNMSGTNPSNFNTYRDSCIGYPQHQFVNELTNLKTLLTNANLSRPLSPLTFAITEMNITYLNPPLSNQASTSKYENTVYGIGCRAFFSGQYWCNMMAAMLDQGTSTSPTSPKIEFCIPWSVHEGRGLGGPRDLGMTRDSASSVVTPNKLSTYQHYQLMATYFNGKFFKSVPNLPYKAQSFASAEDSSIVYVMITNEDSLAHTFSIAWQGNTPPAASYNFTYNIPTSVMPFDSINVYSGDTITGNTTVLLLFNCHGSRLWKMVYTLQDANANGNPHFKMIGNSNVDPQIANCGNSGIGGHINSNTTYSNTTVYVTSDLLITGNNTLTFDNAKVVFSPGVKIKANPNAGIEIKNGTVMFGCNGSQWGGIEMNGNHQLNDHLIINNSILVNAPTVVYADKIGTISIKGSVFANGTTAINLNRSKAFTITGNLIAGYKTAIQTTNTNPNYVSTISENRIIAVDKGLDFNGDSHNLLTIACNYIGYYSKGIYSRNTTLAMQGDANTGAGNTFARIGAGLPSDYIDHTGNSTSYYYGPAQAGAYLFPNVMNIPKIQAVADRLCQQQMAPCKLPVGIKENIKSNEQFLIYPNPSAGTFTIKYSDLPKGNWTLNVHDVLGRMITSKKIDSNTDNTTLQINGKGLYFVILQNGNNRISQKVIVE